MNLTKTEGISELEIYIENDIKSQTKKDLKSEEEPVQKVCNKKPKVNEKEIPKSDNNEKLEIAVDIFNKAQKLSLKQLQKLQAMMDLLTE